MFTRYCWFIIVIIICRCAVQAPPGGGPVDTAPPEVIQVDPEPYATDVSPNTSVTITFNERMDQLSVESALSVTPSIKENFKFRWKGKDVFITFPDSLELNKTYVFSLGTDARDIHHNRLSQSYTWAFTPGDNLNEGSISGLVFGTTDVVGTMLYAYLIDSSTVPNPAFDEPDYTVQSGENGIYTFQFLERGIYRIYALKDENDNEIYNVGTDWIGIPSQDIIINEYSISHSAFNFQLFKEDTVKPKIHSIKAVDNRHVQIEFSEPISIGVSSRGAIRLNKVGQEQAVRALFTDPHIQRVLIAATEPQQPGEEYILILSDIVDYAGNPADFPEKKMMFTGSAITNTIGTSMSIVNPADTLKLISGYDPFIAVFSQGVDSQSVMSTWILKDTLGNRVIGDWNWKGLNKTAFRPKSWLEKGMPYRLHFLPPGPVDCFGNLLTNADSTFIFTVKNYPAAGSLSGRVIDTGDDKNGIFIVSVKGKPPLEFEQSVNADSNGLYHFTQLPPGLYQLDVFQDRDGNGRFSMGRIFPFEPSERFTVLRNLVEVKSGWDVESINITFE